MFPPLESEIKFFQGSLKNCDDLLYETFWEPDICMGTLNVKVLQVANVLIPVLIEIYYPCQ